jgi:hypothetical protein
MEQIFIKIMQKIAERMPGLSLIDEDYGQLDTEEDTYPVTFPCVLIGQINTDWKELGPAVQQGTATCTVKLAIDCYHDTHLKSGTESRIAERLAMANKLYRALQGERFIPEMSPVSRIKSVDYSLPHAIKVYEITFTFKTHDNTKLNLL